MSLPLGTSSSPEVSVGITNLRELQNGTEQLSRQGFQDFISGLVYPPRDCGTRNLWVLPVCNTSSFSELSKCLLQIDLPKARRSYWIAG